MNTDMSVIMVPPDQTKHHRYAQIETPFFPTETSSTLGEPTDLRPLLGHPGGPRGQQLGLLHLTDHHAVLPEGHFTPRYVTGKLYVH